MRYLLLLPFICISTVYAGDYKEPEPVTYVENTYIENTYVSYDYNRLNAIAAMSVALSSIPEVSHAHNHHEDENGNHTAIGIGAGAYGDQSAVSAAIIRHMGDNSFKLNFATSQYSKPMIGVGFTIGVK